MADILFTEKELKYIADTDFLHTGHIIKQKITSLFEASAQELKEELDTGKYNIDPHLIRLPPKISKGENYRGLPWIVLDYPKKFQKEDTFSFRVIFWWGHFFSYSLHLEGAAMTSALPMLKHYWSKMKTENVYACVSSTPWEYHFNSSNYIRSDKITFDQFNDLARTNTFIKISRKATLREWPRVINQTIKTFRLFMLFTGFSAP